jgi:hypothetical protein
MSPIPFTTDDELQAVALKIREANDRSTAINEGFGLQREVPSDDLSVASNIEALQEIMFSDELDTLEQALRRASDEPDLPPLVQAWLSFAQFWPRHEENRRTDGRHQALVESFSGHLLHLVYEFGCRPPAWSWFCECNDDEEEVLFPDRAKAEAAMRFHMTLHDLPESAIYNMDDEKTDGDS